MKIINADCIEAMKEMANDSVDAIVTDPPYELGFMGKKWDNTGIAFNVEVWKQALRVLKPGGHLLAFSGSRTYHRMAVAIEDAGFDIRDQIMWIYGSGFPKSLDVSKAFDKTAGVERKIVGTKMGGTPNTGLYEAGLGVNEGKYISETAPATAAAKQWEGWGTALKPAHEPIVLARKPLIGTVATNVMNYGTGALNIDASRVGRAEGDNSAAGNRTATFGTQETESGGDGSGGWEQNAGGRWPANVIHDGSDEVVALFPDTGKSTGGRIGKKAMGSVTNVPAGEYEAGDPGYGDSGSAARFFYCAKASKRDRNEGLDGFETKQTLGGGGLTTVGDKYGSIKAKAQNHHPTVKPTELMRYLCKLITPPNGIVLDPFMGSGSTGKAAVMEGFEFIGIDQSSEYCEIAKARIDYAQKDVSEFAQEFLL
jgi:site-specific DNA-methyltransferase (adenine-specific)